MFLTTTELNQSIAENARVVTADSVKEMSNHALNELRFELDDDAHEIMVTSADDDPLAKVMIAKLGEQADLVEAECKLRGIV